MTDEGKGSLTRKDIDDTIEDLDRNFPGMLEAMANAQAPDAARARLLPAHHLVDAARPDGWALIPTKTVPDLLDLENIIASLLEPKASSWIHPNGNEYVVPGRYKRDTHVMVNGDNPSEWLCGCAQSHDTAELCRPVLQVALLRGTFMRRTSKGAES